MPSQGSGRKRRHGTVAALGGTVSGIWGLGFRVYREDLVLQ